MADMIVERKLEMKPNGLMGYRMRNSSGGSISAGAPVVLDTATQSGTSVTTTTTQDDPNVFGVMMETVGDGSYGFVAVFGHIDNLKVNGTTDIAVGDKLTTFTTAGIAAKQSAVTKPGIFAIALEAYTTNDSNGVIDAFLMPGGKTDASGNTLTYGTAGQMAADGVAAANAAGSTAAVSRVDHVHTLTADVPAPVLGTSNAAGTAGLVMSSDASLAIFDATVPTTIQADDSAAVGSAAVAARRDHKHAIVSGAPADGSSLGSANAEGTSAAFARDDHAHKSIAKNDVPIILGTTDAAATAARLEYDTAETNDALKLGLDSTSRRLIICDYADMGTDTTRAVATDPTLSIYDATLVDYLELSTTLTSAVLNVPTGNNFVFTVNGTTEYTFTAASFIIESGNRVDFDAAAGSYATFLVDVNNNESIQTQGVASAVNQLGISNAATGAGPILEALGDDANVDLRYLAKGTGAQVFDNGTDPVIVKLMGAAAGYNNEIQDLNGNEIVQLQGVASAVNELSIKNAATTVNPTLEATGGDTNVGMILLAKGTGAHVFDNGTDPVIVKLSGAAGGFNNEIQDVNDNEILGLQGVASAVNELTVLNAATGAGPQLGVQGGDTDIDIRLGVKGTGVLDVRYASIALGGGGSATLGTIGGSGPATAAQNAWMQVKINGTNSWLAFWR